MTGGNKITDETPCPFGKAYYGVKMANVPADYLLWVLDNLSNLRADVRAYIEDNKTALEKEVKNKKFQTKQNRNNERR